MFSEEQLKKLIKGEIIGNTFPFDTSDEQEISAHCKRLFHRINRIPNVKCEAEWNHFGSGYASFVELFCYRKEDVFVVEEKHGIREIEIKGIIVDVSRLVPVAIMGEDERSRKILIDTNEEISSGHGSILDRANSLHIGENLQSVAAELKKVLQEFDYTLLQAEDICEPLSFQTRIPTVYRNPREYLVMDAIFYWED